ncbi:MAG: hypothetical protein A2X55_03535 [Nitrospirae bacterium GWB2_47_37]|nr:MAG: hypothetical protein A2Z82_01295 [Nitrospirae bacterium GWA2_46_11]OGW26104.1 MAG: hypothetical protein A2X55_03535 [Nitrospirae bacterium GWB2_47_37]HAK89441.1 hypothetical protein [Nitrospiraceae bacterium]
MPIHNDKALKVLLKDIVQACAFRNVKAALLMLYPDQRKNIIGYKNVFETLKRLRPRCDKEGMIIDITKVGRGKNAYFDVSGILEKDVRQSYALEFTAWSKWLGYQISPHVLKKMPKEEIIAHCLWEMTFMGITQNKIRREFNKLKKRVEDVKTGKVKTIPLEEVMARLKEKVKKDSKNINA